MITNAELGSDAKRYTIEQGFEPDARIPAQMAYIAGFTSCRELLNKQKELLLQKMIELQKQIDDLGNKDERMAEAYSNYKQGIAYSLQMIDAEMPYIVQHVHCPNCKETLDAAMNTDATTGNIPSDGDISVCAYCGSINVFKEQENGELCLVEMPEDIKKELEEYYPEVWNRIAQLSNHFMKKAS